MKINFSPQRAGNCIGLVETDSIARGIEIADGMLKKAPVEIILSTPTSPGFYLNLITGEVEEVRSSLQLAEDLAGGTLRDLLFLPYVAPSVLQALFQIVKVDELEAVGILETQTQATLLEAADRVAKITDIEFIHIHLGVGIGGKAFFILHGTYEDVEVAMKDAVDFALERDSLLEEVVIGNADPALLDLLLQQKLPQRS